MNFSIILVAFLLLGCASASPQPPTAAPSSVSPLSPPPDKPLAPIPSATEQHEEKFLPIPEDLSVHIKQAEQLGMAIYLQDKVAALGTDVFLANTKPDEQQFLGGYIVWPEENKDGTREKSWLVQFYSRESTPRIAFRIHVPADRRNPTFEKLSPPVPVSEHEALLIRVRQTALTELAKTPRAAQQQINPTLFSARVIGEKGFLVYLLANTTRPGVMVLGQHFQVLVSENGQKVTKITPLSKGALEMNLAPKLPPGAKPVGMVVSHTVTEWPLETHVFASLHYRQPLYVSTAKYLWKVDGPRILLLTRK